MLALPPAAPTPTSTSSSTSSATSTGERKRLVLFGGYAPARRVAYNDVMMLHAIPLPPQEVGFKI
jgi:hypothetical protein